ncbi:NADH-quinone oxidoreductase subunit C [Pelosinus baikalensis]|uniref:NADH-quinone oxidoreductase subunit C n=1 Tax=Pelosinus baikalensis TaxID=2892015 RepID=A0ABS8HLE8_9FIRM|nr:NADH-quinone oxidoreductase subunit C [Pelosinus baikalensis]MCC5464002.1 NADH-quinone oxidoreductase subunit C [Pelosinus baikalensis]
MSSRDINNSLAELQARYVEDVKIIGEEAQTALLVEPHRLLDILEFLKTNELYQCNMLRNLTAVDYLEYIEVVYHLYSLPLRQAITVKTRCDMEDSQIPSATVIWPSANFQEREIYDLLGVRFTGHPDLRRILLRDEFDGHPLRKTYNTGNAGEGGKSSC